MAWLAVNNNGQEVITEEKPTYDGFEWEDNKEVYIESEYGQISSAIYLPKGTIFKIIGREMTCKDEPVEI